MENRISKAFARNNQVRNISMGYLKSGQVFLTLLILAAGLCSPPALAEGAENDKSADKTVEKNAEKGAEKNSEAKAGEKRTGPYAPEAVKHYNAGLELHQAAHLNRAVEEYKAAIAADDRLEQAYSNLGLIYIAQKNFVQAQDAFDKALKLKPNRPTSLNGLASVLLARHQNYRDC